MTHIYELDLKYPTQVPFDVNTYRETDQGKWLRLLGQYFMYSNEDILVIDTLGNFETTDAVYAAIAVLATATSSYDYWNYQHSYSLEEIRNLEFALGECTTTHTLHLAAFKSGKMNAGVSNSVYFGAILKPKSTNVEEANILPHNWQSLYGNTETINTDVVYRVLGKVTFDSPSVGHSQYVYSCGVFPPIFADTSNKSMASLFMSLNEMCNNLTDGTLRFDKTLFEDTVTRFFMQEIIVRALTTGMYESGLVRLYPIHAMSIQSLFNKLHTLGFHINRDDSVFPRKLVMTACYDNRNENKMFSFKLTESATNPRRIDKK